MFRFTVLGIGRHTRIAGFASRASWRCRLRGLRLLNIAALSTKISFPIGVYFLMTMLSYHFHARDILLRLFPAILRNGRHFARLF